MEDIMYRIINEYTAMLTLKVDHSIYLKISDYLKQCNMISKYVITVNVNRFIVDITLKNFDVDNAVNLFNDFNSNISYPYSSIHVRFNEGKCVRYRYLTSNERKEGFYCDIIIH